VVQALREAVRTFDALAVPLQLEARDAFGMRLTSELARPRIKLQLVTSELEASRTAIAVNVIYDSRICFRRCVHPKRGRNVQSGRRQRVRKPHPRQSARRDRLVAGELAFFVEDTLDRKCWRFQPERPSS
jgi:hypothetical protein